MHGRPRLLRQATATADRRKVADDLVMIIQKDASGFRPHAIGNPSVVDACRPAPDPLQFVRQNAIAFFVHDWRDRGKRLKPSSPKLMARSQLLEAKIRSLTVFKIRIRLHTVRSRHGLGHVPVTSIVRLGLRNSDDVACLEDVAYALTVCPGIFLSAAQC